ncbi:hypothetical protein L2K20_20525 [Mycobacterium sp. MBM]|nr:hypothetical protein [Mycobacterium sp. MBM]
MWGDVLNTAVGLVLGLLSGFYFERRSTKSAREHAGELERELEALRASIYTVGGSVSGSLRGSAEAVGKDALLADLHDRARLTQGADGRTSRARLAAHFCALGHPKSNVDKAIETLCGTGQLVADGRWLEVR